jgi:hypothetical protein
MRRRTLQQSEGYQGQQLLETDIMRFVAIIGIVFCITITLANSISSQTQKSVKIQTHLKKLVTVSKEASDEKPDSKPDEPTPTEPSSRAKIQNQGSPQSPGLLLQFQNQETLLDLLASEKIQIFGRAQARGFDLFFIGAVQDDTVCFKGASELPDHLWEIKNYEDQTYFIDLMTKTYPSIRSFSSKQILVCFIDTDLEKRVEKTYSRLQSEGKNGVLSITRSGDVKFQESSSEPAPLTTGVVERTCVKDLKGGIR